MSLTGLISQMSGGHRLRVLSVGCDGGAGDGGSVACDCNVIALAPVRWMGMESKAMGRTHLQMSWHTGVPLASQMAKEREAADT